MAPVLRVAGLRKDYGGLRPLRLEALTLEARARAAIVGLDGASAEVFVSLITGAALADEGTVEIFGRATSAITDAGDWLETLDRFGVLSVRAALIEPLTIRQNLAMAFTLSVEPIPEDVLGRIQDLAAEAGLSSEDLAAPCASASPMVRARCQLGRALATSPDLLILEHANGLVAGGDARAFARHVARAAESRGAALLALTSDERFARAVAKTVLRLDPASGGLVHLGGWRRWFS
ncbi:MAG: ATP-binding cassette domain-containing protein [Acidobacteriota bacterium]